MLGLNSDLLLIPSYWLIAWLLQAAVGATFSWLINSIVVWAVDAVGKVLNKNGVGHFTELKAVIAWALWPTMAAALISLCLKLGVLPLLNGELGSPEITLGGWQRFVLEAVGFVGSIWSLVIVVKGIALVQGFGIGRAILNYLLPFIILAVFGALVFVLMDLYY